MQPDSDIVLAARELQRATIAVRTLLEKDYPNRRELEAQFIRKSEIKNRFALWVVALLISALVSFVGTVTTVSTCFLGESAFDHPQFCEIMPGYQDTLDGQQKLIDQLRELQRRSVSNERRLSDLEGR